MQYEIIDMVNEYSFLTANRVVDMWEMSNVLPKGVDPTTRVAQVVAAVKDGNGYVVGVNTASQQVFDHGDLADQPVYAMRQFIMPASRGFALNKKLLWSSFNILENVGSVNRGVVLVLENQKLTRKGYKKRYTDIGFIQVNAPKVPNEVWYKPFGTKLGEPLPKDFSF